MNEILSIILFIIVIILLLMIMRYALHQIAYNFYCLINGEHKIKKYRLFYKKYDIFLNDYKFVKTEIETNNLYEYVGKIVLKSFTAVKDFRYEEVNNGHKDI